MSSKVLRMAVACAVSLTMSTAVIPAVYNLAGSPASVVRADSTAPTEGEWVVEGYEDESFHFGTFTLTGDLTIKLQGHTVEFDTLNTNGHKLTITSDSTEGSLGGDNSYGFFGADNLNVSGSRSDFIYDLNKYVDPDEISAHIERLNISDGAYACFHKDSHVTIDNIYIQGEHSRLDNAKAIIEMGANPVIGLNGDGASYTGTATIRSADTITINLSNYSRFDLAGSVSKANVIASDISTFHVNTNNGGSLAAGSTVTLNDKQFI